jgi:8-oxo-dGTP pyrophosphatase MutT (NUDIX family)
MGTEVASTQGNPHMDEPSTHYFASLASTEISKRLSRDIKRSAVIHHHPYAFNTATMVSAAVLVPMVSIEKAWHLLFIRRADNENDHHSGQVAFPGGHHDNDDSSLENTALREAWEEVGLRPEDVHILGQLQDHVSTTHFRIRPIVGIVPWPYSLNIDKKEVSRCFTIPLDWLAIPAHREIRHWRSFENRSLIPVIYFREYDGETLWGATARITVDLIDTLMD